MAKTKKIILFIVEGITDQTSLSLALSKIIEKDKAVRFKIINGDITSEENVNVSNILIKLTKHISSFLDNHKFEKSDILEVVHLVDTDGAYIDDIMILKKDISTIEYSTQNIYTNNIEKIKKRNKQKSQILNKLIGTHTIFRNLPYSIYFFSSNLEHVLHNQQNVLSDEKNNYAEKFEDKFSTNTDMFIEFMNNQEFALTGTYKTTWDFIKEDTNSLKRYTNFNLYLNSIITKAN